jgi:hypothetical protein
MTTLLPLNAGVLPTVTPSSSKTNSIASIASAASNTAVGGSESTIVTIPSASLESPLLYTSQGSLTGGEPSVTWAQSNTDAVSLTMAGDAMSNTMSGQFYNLGSALLDRFKTNGSNFSQSVTIAGADGVGATALAEQGAQGDVKLTVKTASGVTVDIEMDSDDGTLAVSMNSSGTLSSSERTALTGLADGFQQAIDGLSGVPPQLNLSGLTQYDPSVLSSVNLQFNVTGEGSNNISANVALNSSTRSVKVTDSTGSINLSVDTSDSAIWGSGAQRDQAIASYLTQFDNANTEGHGDATLMSMFKDAFSQMNGDYGTPSQQLPGTDGVAWVAQSDHAMLTGLADFTGSMTDNAVSSNPWLPDQTDTFSYQVSQSTQTTGNQQSGAISQTQHSSLQASYHESLSGGPVQLGMSPSTQSYNYIQVDDDANSAVNIATQRGQIVQATLNQSSSQSTEKSEYVRGLLVSDVTTPTNSSNSKDLLALLKPFLGDGDAEQDSASWQQELSTLHGMVLLNANPD